MNESLNKVRSNSTDQMRHYDRHARKKLNRDTNQVSAVAREETVLKPIKRQGYRLGTMMDFGCGNGAKAEYLQGAYEEFHGYDISERQIRNAKDLFANHSNVQFHTGDLLEDVEVGIKFDTVFIDSVLHHMSAPRVALEKVSKHLKMGGQFVIIEPHKGGYLLGALRNIRKVIDESYDNDQVAYAKTELQSLIPENFEISENEVFGLMVPYFSQFPLRPYFFFMPLLKVAIMVDNFLEKRRYRFLTNYCWNQYLICKKI